MSNTQHEQIIHCSKMLVIEVQLPQQEERKKIEWNKNGDPTFAELKDRIQHCGVPDDWCVEVLRGTNFVSPDLNTHIQGPKITVRASPVLGYLQAEEEHLDDIQWTRWMKTAFEKVIHHVGKLYLVEKDSNEPESNELKDSQCVGTVSLMDCHGEAICALHCIQPAVENPEKYKIHASFPNYSKGALTYEAKPKNMDEEVDVCVIEPSTPLKNPYLPTSYLDLATDVREDDVIYCFFYPKDPLKHETPKPLSNLLIEKKKKFVQVPSIISGTVCFSEWMQGVAAYERPPDCNGGVLVSRSGRVKGIHVKAFTCGELRAKVHSENPEELRVARKLCKRMSTYAATECIPVFVPPHGLVRLLGLEGGCELLQAAVRQSKGKVKMNMPVKPPKSTRLPRRSRCPTPYHKTTRGPKPKKRKMTRGRE